MITPVESIGLILIMALLLFSFVLIQQKKTSDIEISSIFETSEKKSNLLLMLSFKKIYAYSAKGRWMLFISYFFLITYGFILLYNYLNLVQKDLLPFTIFEKDLQLSLKISLSLYLFCSVAFSTKLIISSQNIYTFNKKYSIFGGYLEEKLDNINEEQYKKLAIYLAQKLQNLEGYYIICIIFNTISFILFFIVAMYWIFYLFN